MEVLVAEETHQNESTKDVATSNDMRTCENEEVVRKSCCRYGSGCTHIHDPSHSDKFWHPAFPKLNRDQLKTQFICNECGYAASQLKDLQLHLQRKTAWSNLSLVGCRINCLVDSREWHEGFVLQFHKSGKHFVEFRLASEKRWLIMKKIAFYILERPVVMNKDGSEFKDDDESDGLAPIEDNWVFCEDITMDYAFSQSVLFKIYGNTIQETGHLTRGHTCLTDADRLNAQYVKGSLLYGELLPRGANKAFGPKRLDSASASVLFDLGMGTGKILIQAFLQCKNLRYIFGIELSAGRYKLAEEALLRMVRLLGADSYHVQVNPGKFIIVTEVVRKNSEVDQNGELLDPHEASADAKSEHSGSESGKEEYVERVLHMQCGNMFDVKNIATADIVMMETDIPQELHARLLVLLSGMKDDSRVLTYLDLRRIWANTHLLFKQLEVNRHQADRYPTSWSVQRGHHFFLWSKVSTTQQDMNHSPSWEWGISRLVSGATGSHNNYSPSPTQNTPGGGTTDSPIALNRTTSPHGSPLSRVNSGGRTGQRYSSEHTGTNAGAEQGDEEFGEADDHCMPYSLLSFVFGSGRGSSRRKNKKIVRAKDLEQNKDRAVVPVNADGTRVTTPRRIVVEPLSLPSRSSGTCPGSGTGSGTGSRADSPSPPEPDNAALSPRAASTPPRSASDKIPHNEPSLGTTQLRNKYGSYKGRHRDNDPTERISTMGLESVRLRTPRQSPRESPRTKKRDKGTRSARSSFILQPVDGSTQVAAPDAAQAVDDSVTTDQSEVNRRAGALGLLEDLSASATLLREVSSSSPRTGSRGAGAGSRTGYAGCSADCSNVAVEPSPRLSSRSPQACGDHGRADADNNMHSSAQEATPRSTVSSVKEGKRTSPPERLPSRPTSPAPNREAPVRSGSAGGASEKRSKERSRPSSGSPSSDGASNHHSHRGSPSQVVDEDAGAYRTEAGAPAEAGVSSKHRSSRPSSKKKRTNTETAAEGADIRSADSGSAQGSGPANSVHEVADSGQQPSQSRAHTKQTVNQGQKKSGASLAGSSKSKDSCTIS